MITKIRNTVSWTYVIEYFNGEEIVGKFYEKALQKVNQTVFRIDEIIKRKDDKQYVNWEVYDNYFKNWINKKNVLVFNMSYFSRTIYLQYKLNKN